MEVLNNPCGYTPCSFDAVHIPVEIPFRELAYSGGIFTLFQSILSLIVSSMFIVFYFYCDDNWFNTKLLYKFFYVVIDRDSQRFFSYFFVLINSVYVILSFIWLIASIHIIIQAREAVDVSCGDCESYYYRFYVRCAFFFWGIITFLVCFYDLICASIFIFTMHSPALVRDFIEFLPAPENPLFNDTTIKPRFRNRYDMEDDFLSKWKKPTDYTGEVRREDSGIDDILDYPSNFTSSPINELEYPLEPPKDYRRDDPAIEIHPEIILTTFTPIVDETPKYREDVMSHLESIRASKKFYPNYHYEIKTVRPYKEDSNEVNILDRPRPESVIESPIINSMFFKDPPMWNTSFSEGNLSLVSNITFSVLDTPNSVNNSSFLHLNPLIYSNTSTFKDYHGNSSILLNSSSKTSNVQSFVVNNIQTILPNKTSNLFGQLSNTIGKIIDKIHPHPKNRIDKTEKKNIKTLTSTLINTKTESPLLDSFPNTADQTFHRIVKRSILPKFIRDLVRKQIIKRIYGIIWHIRRFLPSWPSCLFWPNWFWPHWFWPDHTLQDIEQARKEKEERDRLYFIQNVKEVLTPLSLWFMRGILIWLANLILSALVLTSAIRGFSSLICGSQFMMGVAPQPKKKYQTSLFYNPCLEPCDTICADDCDDPSVCYDICEIPPAYPGVCSSPSVCSPTSQTCPVFTLSAPKNECFRLKRNISTRSSCISCSSEWAHANRNISYNTYLPDPCTCCSSSPCQKTVKQEAYPDCTCCSQPCKSKFSKFLDCVIAKVVGDKCTQRRQVLNKLKEIVSGANKKNVPVSDEVCEIVCGDNSKSGLNVCPPKECEEAKKICPPPMIRPPCRDPSCPPKRVKKAFALTKRDCCKEKPCNIEIPKSCLVNPCSPRKVSKSFSRQKCWTVPKQSCTCDKSVACKIDVCSEKKYADPCEILLSECCSDKPRERPNQCSNYSNPQSCVSTDVFKHPWDSYSVNIDLESLFPPDYDTNLLGQFGDQSCFQYKKPTCDKICETECKICKKMRGIRRPCPNPCAQQKKKCKKTSVGSSCRSTSECVTLRSSCSDSCRPVCGSPSGDKKRSCTKFACSQTFCNKPFYKPCRVRHVFGSCQKKCSNSQCKNKSSSSCQTILSNLGLGSNKQCCKKEECSPRPSVYCKRRRTKVQAKSWLCIRGR